jgi:hypothetical protein
MRLAALALGTALSAPIAAQVPSDSASPDAYSHLRIRASGARNVNHEALHDFWRSGTGAGLAVTTPFYLGSIGVNATLLPFRRRDSSRPNFRALMLGIDWGAGIPIGGPVRVRAAARVGDFVMLIENPDVWLDSESELFVGGELSASFAVYRNLSLAAAGSFAHVHTRPSLDLAVVTIGLEYATRTPGWLRAILE